MSGRLPAIDFRRMDRALRRLGFEAVRQKGSHVFYRHPDGRTTTVPHHGNRDLARPLVRAVLSDIGMTQEEFRAVLEG